jgi:hypothetical protein
MVRYSFSSSFVVIPELPGEFMFYVTHTKWVDDKAVESKTIHQKHCKMVPDLDDCIDPLSWSAEMADRAWNEIIAVRSAARHEA